LREIQSECKGAQTTLPTGAGTKEKPGRIKLREIFAPRGKARGLEAGQIVSILDTVRVQPIIEASRPA
jgi:hypothetical protein